MEVLICVLLLSVHGEFVLLFFLSRQKLPVSQTLKSKFYMFQVYFGGVWDN